DTDSGRQRSAATSQVPGYRFLENLGSSPLADVWRVEARDGRQRVIRLIYGLGGSDRRELEETVRRLEALHHPALNRIEVVQCDPGRLVLVSDLIEQTLRDRCQPGLKQGGVTRADLLAHLGCAAELLDYLYRQHAIHHLGLSPRNLLL